VASGRSATIAIVTNPYAALTAILAMVMAPALVTTSLLPSAATSTSSTYPVVRAWRDRRRASFRSGTRTAQRHPRLRHAPGRGYGYPPHWLPDPAAPDPGDQLAGRPETSAGWAWHRLRPGGSAPPAKARFWPGSPTRSGKAMVARDGPPLELPGGERLGCRSPPAGVRRGWHGGWYRFALVVALMTLAGQPVIASRLVAATLGRVRRSA
jgi:hypothetical protein